VTHAAPERRTARSDPRTNGLPATGRPNSPEGRHASGPGREFAAVVGWTLLGSLVPGARLWLRVGRRGRRLPRMATVLPAVVVAVVTAVVALSTWTHPTNRLTSAGLSLVEQVAVDPSRLAWLAVACGVGALAWTAWVVGTHVAVRRHADLRRVQRAACTLLVLSLVTIGALPAVKLADYALVTRRTLLGVFGQNTSQGVPGARQPQVGQSDPWASLPRVNVLLIGSDAGADRTGVRPDTMIVASIDTRSGDTVLFSLPRNLQRVPFPPGSAAAAAYPHGFSCENPSTGVNTECLLNGVWTFAQQHAHDYYRGVVHPGLTATMQAAEQVTGLSINNYVMINLRGFMDFVDALGGVMLTIRERLPVGGNVENRAATTSWLDPGRRRLDGYQALWFARSRWSTSDYDRMRRQRCVIGAVSQEADPVTLARNFPAIARSAQRNIQTDIGLAQLQAWVQLGQRVQHAAVRSLPFTDQVIDTVHPDFDRVHTLVQQALEPPATTVAQPAPSTPAATASAGRRAGTFAVPPAAEDVRAVC